MELQREKQQEMRKNNMKMCWGRLFSELLAWTYAYYPYFSMHIARVYCNWKHGGSFSIAGGRLVTRPELLDCGSVWHPSGVLFSSILPANNVVFRRLSSHLAMRWTSCWQTLIKALDAPAWRKMKKKRTMTLLRSPEPQQQAFTNQSVITHLLIPCCCRKLYKDKILSYKCDHAATAKLISEPGAT